VGNPGYYLLALDSDGEPTYDVNGQPVITGNLVELPIQARIGMEYGYEAENLTMTTERGRRWVYPQYEREVRRMTFRLKDDGIQLNAFYDLHVAVRGSRDPFIWIPDVDASPLYRFFCRKEAHLMVEQLRNVAHGRIVDYQMTLTGEPTGPEITD
jgi:hypothetical protein